MKKMRGFACALTALSLAMLFAVLSLPALAEEYDEDFEYINVDLYWHDGAWTLPEGIETLDYRYRFNTYNPLCSSRLPSTLKVIGESDLLYAFDGYRLEIPEGVVDIRDMYIEYGSIRRIKLPSTLESVYGGVFSSCESLEFIRLAEGNEHYKVVDNVLFTKDGKTLVCYPAGKRDAHYDVPRGVETIGECAFVGNDHLLSLTLPLGVKTIERCGISDCGRLEYVSLPLTIRDIGEWCFSDCVSLTSIAVPSKATLGERCFENSPQESGGELYVKGASGRYFSFNEDESMLKKSEDEIDREYYRWREEGRPALISPQNVAVRVPIYDAPSDNPRILDNGESGSYVEVTNEAPTYCEVLYYSDNYTEAAQKGYVRRDQLTFINESEPLFEIETVIPHERLKGSLSELRLMPTVAMAWRVREGACDIRVDELYGQWAECHCTWLETEDGDAYINSGYLSEFGVGMLWLGDATFKRVYTGDDRTLGMTVTSATYNRVNLRERASRDSQSLGKYFTGVQLEVLGEKDGFYNVRMIDGQTGWIMKEYVQIVEQEAF